MLWSDESADSNLACFMFLELVVEAPEPDIPVEVAELEERNKELRKERLKVVGFLGGSTAGSSLIAGNTWTMRDIDGES